MIIGSIAAIIILVWFYYSAEGYGRNPVHWAIAGFLVYSIVSLCWTYFVNPSIKDAAMHGRDFFLMYVSRYAYIAVSLTCAVVFNLKVGPQNKE
ncbi:MAG: hypothetical protein KAH20_15640 [Methylococcales bacterium]|nr:hypothetical protein [Methylococcales bacterium]